MSDTDASKLTILCTSLAVVGVLLGLAFNSGATATGDASAVAVAPATASVVVAPLTASGVAVAPASVQLAN